MKLEGPAAIFIATSLTLSALVFDSPELDPSSMLGHTGLVGAGSTAPFLLSAGQGFFTTEAHHVTSCVTLWEYDSKAEYLAVNQAI